MDYTALLAGDEYLVVSKPLMRMLGIKAAVMLTQLCSEYRYYKVNGELAEDGSFFSTVQNMEENTTLSKYEQQQAIKVLEDIGAIKTTTAGIPPVRRVTIIQDGLAEIVEKLGEFSKGRKTRPLKGEKLATNNKELVDNTSSSFTSSSTYIYVDDRWTKIHDTYFSYFHTEPMGMDSQRLRQYLDEVGMDAVLYAMEEAHKRDVHVPGAYIRRICESLILRGISDDESFKRFKDSLPQSQVRVTADKVDWDALIAKARKEQEHDS